MDDEEIYKHMRLLFAKELERSEYERSLGEVEFTRRVLRRKLKGVYAVFDAAVGFNNPDFISGTLRSFADQIDAWFVDRSKEARED